MSLSQHSLWTLVKFVAKLEIVTKSAKGNFWLRRTTNLKRKFSYSNLLTSNILWESTRKILLIVRKFRVKWNVEVIRKIIRSYFIASSKPNYLRAKCLLRAELSIVRVCEDRKKSVIHKTRNQRGILKEVTSEKHQVWSPYLTSRSDFTAH